MAHLYELPVNGVLRSSCATVRFKSLLEWPREFRNPRISYRGREGSQRYGQRRDDRATDPIAPGMRSRDRARHQRTRVDGRLLRDEGERGCPEHDPEVSPHQRAA